MGAGAEGEGRSAGPSRHRRRALLRRGCSVAILLLLGALAALWSATRRTPLPIPEAFLPAHGSITAIEVPRGASTEVDAAIAAILAQLPATLAFVGSRVELPTGFAIASEMSGPWRVSLWKEGGGERPGRFLLFAGGEAFGPWRARAAREAARRLDGREGLAAAAAGGGVLLGDDRELVLECAARADAAERRSIPRDGIRFWRDDAERGAALELWWAPAGGDRLLARWRGAEDAFPWREWLLDHGVETTPLEDAPRVAGERSYRLDGARSSLAELVEELGRW
jgi:hypothetical protein